MGKYILFLFLIVNVNRLFAVMVGPVYDRCEEFESVLVINFNATDLPSGATDCDWWANDGDCDLETKDGCRYQYYVDEGKEIIIYMQFKGSSGNIGGVLQVSFKVGVRPEDLTAKGTSTTLQSTSPPIDLRSLFNIPDGSPTVEFTSNVAFPGLISGNTFDPSKVTSGYPNTITITCRVYYDGYGWCDATATTEIVVYNGNASLPSFLRPLDALPICQNSSNFDMFVVANCYGTMRVELDYEDDGSFLPAINISASSYDPFTGAYLYRFSINPSAIPYNGSFLIGIRVTKLLSGSDAPYCTSTQSITGKIPVTPRIRPQISGISPSSLYNPPGSPDAVLDATLCSASLSEYTMNGFPSGGFFKIYMNDDLIPVYNGFDLDAPPATELAIHDEFTFIPNEVFNDPELGNGLLTNTYRIVYVYPINPVGSCPDSVTVRLTFKENNDFDFALTTASPYCYGTPINLTVLNSTEPTDRFIWEFRDEDDNVLKVTEKLPATPDYVHEFAEPGNYKIRMQAFSVAPGLMCDNDVMKPIAYGAKPIANFTVKGLKEDLATEFVGFEGVEVINKEAGDNVVKWYWNWDSDNTTTYQEEPDRRVFHTFTDITRETYNVTLIVEAGWGCTDTISRYLPVFDSVGVTSLTPYVEDFNNNTEANSFYHSGEFESKLSVSSWENITAAAAGYTVMQSDNAAWFTSENFDVAQANGKAGYYHNERSWIETPYFDLSLLELPVMMVDVWSQLDDNFDGVAIQYCTDENNFGEEVWTTIGDDKSGSNWYNSPSINAQPGRRYPGPDVTSYFLGWTNNTDTDWKLAAYPLDDVKTATAGRLVRFRISFASNGDNFPGNFEGFGFDNFRIENRDRFILLESFISSNTNALEILDDVIDDPQAIVIRNLVQLDQNDIPAPADLADYNFNKADPGVRSLYYGLNKLPRTIIDGTERKALPFTTVPAEDALKGQTIGWGQKAYELERLKMAPFSFTGISANVIAGELVIDATLENTRSANTVDTDYNVQVAIVSNDGNYLLRKLLPSAAGTRIVDWNTATYDLPTYRWKPVSGLPIADGIQIIFYIQNENTKEIYQTTRFVKTDLAGLQYAADPAITQGRTLRTAEVIPDVACYPNPAASELFVEFEIPLNAQVQYTIQNNLGTEMKSGLIAAGVDLQRLLVSDLNNGYYSITLKTNGDSKTLSFVKQ